MWTSTFGIPKRLSNCAQLVGVASLLLCSPGFAETYPVNGVWVTHNRDFPIGPNEVCFTIKLSGVEAVARKLISGLIIFNENKRYEVKQNLQTVSTLVSTKPAEGGYWVIETPDVRRRFWFKQKVTYLLTVIDPSTIEIRSKARRTRFVKCGPRGKLSI